MNFFVFTYTGLAPIRARNQKVTTIRFKTAVQNQRVPFANQENHPIIRMKIPSFIDLNMAWKSPACMRRQAGLGSLDVVYNQQWLLLCLSPCHFSIQLLGLGIGKRVRLTSLGDNPSCACNSTGYLVNMRDGELWLISTCT